MATSEIRINGTVLAWAMAEAGMSTAELAARIPRANPREIESWTAGQGYPTKGQLSALANALRRPTSIFFMPSPPSRSTIPVQLRTARGRTSRELDGEELRQLRRAKRLQRIMRWILEQQGTEPVALPRVSVNADPLRAGQLLREWIGIDVRQQLRWRNSKTAFDTFRTEFEGRGLFILQMSLGKGGLRGFSLLDDLAPMVAVTTAGNLQSRIFTLFHEFAHLASRSESSCLSVGIAIKEASLERWCDETASAALLPPDELREVTNSVRVSARPPFDEVDLVRRVADRFSVSLRATAVAMIRGGMIRPSSYNEIELAAPVSDSERGFAPGAGGQRAPERRLGEIGRRPSHLILRSLEQNHLTEADVRRLLRLDGHEINELASAVGVVG